MNIACDHAIIRDLKSRFEILCREQGITDPAVRANLARELFADLDAASIAALAAAPARTGEQSTL